MRRCRESLQNLLNLRDEPANPRLKLGKVSLLREAMPLLQSWQRAFQQLAQLSTGERVAQAIAQVFELAQDLLRGLRAGVDAEIFCATVTLYNLPHDVDLLVGGSGSCASSRGSGCNGRGRSDESFFGRRSFQPRSHRDLRAVFGLLRLDGEDAEESDRGRAELDQQRVVRL